MQVSEFLAKVEQGQRDFRNVSLRKANLHSAQLPLLNLDGADLEGADLTNANLAGSSLSHAQLGKAKLSGANLLGSQCFKTYFREADLSNALLSGADLQGCDFKQADLSKASCVGVDLSGANLRYAKLNHANLKAAKLKGTDLYGANTEGTDLEGADVADIIWPDGTEQLLIDEEVPADSPDPSSGGTEQSPSSLAATLPQDPSQPVQSEPQESMRFGDFDLERQDQFSTFSTTSFQQAQNLAQQRSLKLASQIASRLDRQVEYRFKKAVRSSYGDRCALSKSTISTLLETVVIFPDVESDRDHPSNGLLLRIDLARLFKVNLITIHPKTYRVILAPSLQKSEYAGFAGAKLRLPSESSHHPNSNCLQAHFDQCDWIVSEQEEKLETSSEAIETSPLSDAKPSRFVQLSKLWLKRIQEVLHTPINPSLARSKPSLEHGAELEDHTSASGELEAIVEDSIVPDVAVEHPLETKEINLVPESSVGDVSPDEEESSTSDSSGEFIAFSPIETAEDQEESSVEMDSLPKPPPLIKNRPSFLPFPAPPPHFRPSSVTRKLDRLQDELDKISQELEPYLPSTEPIEDVSVLIDTIEKELQESVPSTIVDREFESLFGQKVNPPLPEDLSEASEDLEVSSEAEDLTADQSVETTPPINEPIVPPPDLRTPLIFSKRDIEEALAGIGKAVENLKETIVTKAQSKPQPEGSTAEPTDHQDEDSNSTPDSQVTADPIVSKPASQYDDDITEILIAPKPKPKSEESPLVVSQDSISEPVDGLEESPFAVNPDTISEPVESLEASPFAVNLDTIPEPVESLEASPFAVNPDSISEPVESLEASPFAVNPDSISEPVESLEESPFAVNPDSIPEPVESLEESPFAIHPNSIPVGTVEEAIVSSDPIEDLSLDDQLEPISDAIETTEEAIVSPDSSLDLTLDDQLEPISEAIGTVEEAIVSSDPIEDLSLDDQLEPIAEVIETVEEAIVSPDASLDLTLDDQLEPISEAVETVEEAIVSPDSNLDLSLDDQLEPISDAIETTEEAIVSPDASLDLTLDDQLEPISDAIETTQEAIVSPDASLDLTLDDQLEPISDAIETTEEAIVSPLESDSTSDFEILEPDLISNPEHSLEAITSHNLVAEIVEAVSGNLEITTDESNTPHDPETENPADLFDDWKDTAPETIVGDDPPASVTAEELAQDFDKETKPEEGAVPEPVRKGLAALLFRRFIR